MTGVDLVDFLLARIAEDEAAAREVVDATGSPGPSWHVADEDLLLVVGDEKVAASAPWPEEARHIARWDPDRVLAECGAKALIVAEHRDQHECTDLRASGWPYVGCNVLRLLALPYAAHPDYRPEWRP